MNKIQKFFGLFVLLLLLGSCELLEDAANEQQNSVDIAAGLKEALRVGTDTATARLGITDGYLKDQAVKILLPAEMQEQIADLKATEINILGLGTITGEQLYNAGLPEFGIKSLANIEDDLIVGVNKAAESAATEAAPIFYNAITGITINDAQSILYGSDSAATAYLIDNTYQSLFTTYEPKIDQAVNSITVGNQTVEELYASFVAEYNNIVSTSVPISLFENVTIGSIAGINTIENVDISTHATEKGLDGLFLKVKDEEGKIRNNISNRVTDLLERVFGLLD